MSALTQTVPPLDTDRIIAETDAAVARIKAAREAIGKVIYGQSPVIERALITILAGGHGLLHDLPAPFHVLATQNPLEQEGTYPLPEAQLDRFLLQIDVLYPERDAERRMLFETTGATEARAEPVLDAAGVRTIQQLVRRMPVGESVVEAILNLVRSARPDNADAKLAAAIAWGPGPRASQSLMLACRARALIDGRYAPSLDDVIALAEPVLQHRMALSFAARADGMTVRDVIAELKAKIS